MMKHLSGEIIIAEHHSQFIDKKDRITVKIKECDALYNDIRLPVDDISNYHLGQSITISLLFGE